MGKRKNKPSIESRQPYTNVGAKIEAFLGNIEDRLPDYTIVHDTKAAVSGTLSNDGSGANDEGFAGDDDKDWLDAFNDPIEAESLTRGLSWGNKPRTKNSDVPRLTEKELWLKEIARNNQLNLHLFKSDLKDWTPDIFETEIRRFIGVRRGSNDTSYKFIMIIPGKGDHSSPDKVKLVTFVQELLGILLHSERQILQYVKYREGAFKVEIK